MRSPRLLNPAASLVPEILAKELGIPASQLASGQQAKITSLQPFRRNVTHHFLDD